jgi:hypothetical protein
MTRPQSGANAVLKPTMPSTTSAMPVMKIVFNRPDVKGFAEFADLEEANRDRHREDEQTRDDHPQVVRQDLRAHGVCLTRGIVACEVAAF